ncbi:hypothetical protein ACRRTK_024427 [Alexandromys fortis]
MDLAGYPRLASCLCLPSVGIPGVHHRTQLSLVLLRNVSLSLMSLEANKKCKTILFKD